MTEFEILYRAVEGAAPPTPRGQNRCAAKGPAAGYADAVDAVIQVYHWSYLVLFYATAALRAWALIDCVTRKAAAFPATDKLTKPVWLLILLVSGLIGTFASPPEYPLSLVSIVVAAVYLADVRPAVRGITSGR